MFRRPSGTRPGRRAVAPAAAAVLAVLTVAGCTGSDGADDGRDAKPPAASVPTAVPGADASLPAKARTAENVRNVLLARITEDEERFGSGTESVCSTASAEMFTAKCAAAVTATGESAELALREIGGRAGFATLDSVARGLRAAARGYEASACASAPAAEATRTECRKHAAVIAQGYEDLRTGSTAALAGQ